MKVDVIVSICDRLAALCAFILLVCIADRVDRIAEALEALKP